MSVFSRIFGWLLPDDPEPGCGYGPFKLAQDHPFTPACNLHDYEFGLAHQGIQEMSKDDADWDLFWRWVLIAKNQDSKEKRAQLLRDIFRYYPLAQWGGDLLWDGH